MKELDIRPHWRWKFLDWFWLAPFVMFMSLSPTWRKKYNDRFITVSVLTGTVYTGGGRQPSEGALAHEQRHVQQAAEHGLMRWGLRYVLSPRWRIWYEAEAFAVQGRGAADTVAVLREMYMVYWPDQHIAGIVAAARAKMGVS